MLLVLGGVGIVLTLITLWKVLNMSEATERLVTEVAELTTVVDGAVTLIEGLATAIRDNIDDEDALNALADELDANSNRLADAVAANTQAEDEPVDPEPNPSPEPAPSEDPDAPIQS